ncbi:MAG: hypothetical protein QXG38_01260 [Candidatus Hadarchaeales archaeon]
MKGWILLGVLAIILIALPIYALTLEGLARIAGQAVLTIYLLLLAGGAGLFGYICAKAQATKWGVGLLVITILCLLGIYYIWVGHIP